MTESNLDQQPTAPATAESNIEAVEEALLPLLQGLHDPDVKVASWNNIYQFILEQEVMISSELWLRVLDDKDIGPVVPQREERFKALLTTLPLINGYPTRSDGVGTESYIDGQWVKLAIVEGNGEEN